MSVKISYFDARGKTEPTRWILSYAGVKFEDIRTTMGTFPEEPLVLPQEIKQKTRWGHVPYAELGDGKSLNQSLAIARYFARKYNLVPKDDYEAALCDEFVDTIVDYLDGWGSVEVIMDPAQKQEKMDEFFKTSKTKYLDVFERFIQANGGKHLVGNSPTWAELYLSHAINHVQVSLGVDIFTSHLPGIKTVYEGVVTTPGIKGWLAKRPQTRF